METLAQEFDDLLRNTHEPPCLSLYQPTHRHHPDNRQDPIRYRNLVKELHDALQQQYPQRDATALMQPFHTLAGDREFWNQTCDGLAVLASRELFRVYRLQRPVPQRASVADSFHVKPLIRILQSADRYQLLALTRDSVRLFEGNRDALDEIPPAPGVPRTVRDALGEELSEPYLTASTHRSGGTDSAIFHGHGSKREEQNIDMERFFRAVDRAVLEHHSRPTHLPLILAALQEYHTPFRRISHNPQLASESISINPGALDLPALRQLAWKSVEPRYLALTAQLVERFNGARANGLATDELPRAAQAAISGRVATLLIDADRHVPGHLDMGNGRVELSQPDATGVDDLLDDVGELVLKRGGQAVVIPSERMPTHTGLAAIYRY